MSTPIERPIASSRLQPKVLVAISFQPTTVPLPSTTITASSTDSRITARGPETCSLGVGFGIRCLL